MINKTTIFNILICVFFIILFLIGIIGGIYNSGIDYFAYYFSLPFYLIAEKTSLFIAITIYITFLILIIIKRDKIIYKINLILFALNVIAFLLILAISNLWGLAITKLFGN